MAGSRNSLSIAVILFVIGAVAFSRFAALVQKTL